MYPAFTKLFKFILIISGAFLFSCKGKDDGKDTGSLVPWENRLQKSINDSLNSPEEEKVKNSLIRFLEEPGRIRQVYKTNNNSAFWSKDTNWLPQTDSLFNYIFSSENEGLFPEDYHFSSLKYLKDSLDRDTAHITQPGFWAKADILLSDGFLKLMMHLKKGRLLPDSLNRLDEKDPDKDIYIKSFLELQSGKTGFSNLLVSLQPAIPLYWDLKAAIPRFVKTMDRRVFTHLVYPYNKNDPKDSIHFYNTLKKRLREEKLLDSLNHLPDSVLFAKALKKYQLKNNLQADGKIGQETVNDLNYTDREKFNRIAVTLDKLKELPVKMPEKYILVNIPGYYLRVIDNDTVSFESKVICGKPETSTPELVSEISDIITYPTWTVPNSIIVKQYLPRLKNNPNYISRIGLKLLNSKGQPVDPYTINWSKYNKGIPYKVMQASGDNNSLGVIKFNFNNPYSVYLHDTNQRYLFNNKKRALSHGCVRVQDWEKLAYFIAENDSVSNIRKDTLKYTADSIRNWLARKEKHVIDVKHHIPLYIKYLSCEAKAGKLIFYEDIYGDDRLLTERFFTAKNR